MLVIILVNIQPIIILSLIKKYFNFGIMPPRPYQYINKSLQSSLVIDLGEVVNKVSELMPQFSDFIVQFNNVVMDNSINVITEANGNMSLDVPSSMSDNKAEQLSKRISVLDRLITTRGEEIDTLLHKGLEIEKNIKEQDPQFTSQILEKINEFKRLNNSYKH